MEISALPVITISEADNSVPGIDKWQVFVNGYPLFVGSAFDDTMRKCINLLAGVDAFYQSRAGAQINPKGYKQMADRVVQRAGSARPVSSTTNRGRTTQTPTADEAALERASVPTQRVSRNGGNTVQRVSQSTKVEANSNYARIGAFYTPEDMRWFTNKIAEEIGEGVDFAIMWLSGTVEQQQLGNDPPFDIMQGVIQRIDENGDPDETDIEVSFTGKAVVSTLAAVCKQAGGGQWEGTMIATLRYHRVSRDRGYWVLE